MDNRPGTARPTTARNNYKSSNIPKTPNQFDSSDDFIKESEELSSRKDNTRLEKENNFLLSDYTYDQKTELEKIISEENERIEYLHKQKSKMNSIELIEKNKEGLYDWKTLFSKSRPITAYTQSKSLYVFPEDKKLETFSSKNININLSENIIDNVIENNENTVSISLPKDRVGKDKQFIFPIFLINEKEEKIKEYISIPKNISMKRNKMENANKSIKNIPRDSNPNKTARLTHSNMTENIIHSSRGQSKAKVSFNNISLNKTLTKHAEDKRRPNAARPQSVYAERRDDDVFYLNQAFSDYFTQDFFEFASKIPLLHPKIRCKNKTLQNTLKFVKRKNKEIETFKEQKEKEDILIEQRHLNLAGNSKNIAPLLKSIHKQIYTDAKEEIIPSNKMYFNSNKPLGNIEKNIDYKNNIRSQNMMNVLKYRQFDLKENEKIDYETYDVDDPEIKIFFEKNSELKLNVENEEKVKNNSKEILTITNTLQKDSLELEKNKLIHSENKITPAKSMPRPRTALAVGKMTANFKKAKRDRTKSVHVRDQKISNAEEFKNNTLETVFDDSNIKTIKMNNKVINMYQTIGNGFTNTTNKNIYSNSYSNLPNTEFIPNTGKTLLLREKPVLQSYAYQNLQNTLLTNKFNTIEKKKKIMGVNVKNLQDEIKMKSYQDSLDNYNLNIGDKIISRPKTSINFRPATGNKLNKITENKDMKFVKNKNLVTKNPENNFNNYIDIQFRGMNPNSRFYNSYKKDEVPYFIKNYNQSNLVNTELGDVMKIKNYKYERSIKSAKPVA